MIDLSKAYLCLPPKHLFLAIDAFYVCQDLRNQEYFFSCIIEGWSYVAKIPSYQKALLFDKYSINNAEKFILSGEYNLFSFLIINS